MLNSVEHEKSFITSGPDLSGHFTGDTSSRQLSKVGWGEDGGGGMGEAVRKEFSEPWTEHKSVQKTPSLFEL